jgi:hypothetical protein
MSRYESPSQARLRVSEEHLEPVTARRLLDVVTTLPARHGHALHNH